MLQKLHRAALYRLGLIAVVVAFGLIDATSASAAFSAVLQGQSRGSTTWIAGNLQNWRELDSIPCRVYVDGGPATSQAITVNFDHFSNRHPGIEDLTQFTTSSNDRFDSPPGLSAPTDSDTWSYSFTISLTNNQPGFVEFRARLMAGAHLNTGSSLAMKWKSGLGVLQIHKPAPGVGAPDLLIVKSGPATTYAGSIISYRVNFTNRVVNATGIQVNDILPDAVTYVPGSATGGGHLVGNNLIWDAGTLAPNGGGSFSYSVTVNPALANGFTFTNYASIYSAENDANYDDNVSFVMTRIVAVPPPTAANDAYAVDEDTVLTVASPGVLANDSDPLGRTLTALLVNPPVHGTVSLAANGSFVYTPALNYSGSDQFTYKASNGTATSGVATVTITVRPVNDAPVAVDDSFVTAEDTTLTVAVPGVLANDSDVDGDVLRAILLSPPAHGTVTLDSNGGFVYVPAANFNGVDSFNYKANDGALDSGTAAVRINVTPVNDSPVAQDDAYTTPEDTTLTVAIPGVLGNDSDADGDLLQAILVIPPAHGTLTLRLDGSFVYVPSTNFSGADSFVYKANDAALDSANATVRIMVTPVNDAPIAVDDAYTVAEDTTLAIGAPGVLGNDSDADGDVLRAILLASPAHGTVTLNSNGGFSYLPNTNFHGADSFTYKANDGSLDSAVATVRINVTPLNDAPVAQDDTYTTPEDMALTVAAPGVLANDADPDGDPLRAVLVTGPAHGTVTLAVDGSFVYVPAANFNGADSFVYKANDAALDSGTATVRITVTPVNDAPLALDDAYTVAEDTTLTIAAPGVLGNDSDAEGDLLRAVPVTMPAHGTVTLNSNGGFVYIPNTNFAGADSFTYKANDGSLDSGIATVSITVTPRNDPPVAVDDAYTTEQDRTLTVSIPGVLGNDTDADGDALQAVLVSGPAHGTLTLHSDGSFIYVPAASFKGADAFVYKANDARVDSATATVRITVTPINHAPVANDDAFIVVEDNTLSVAAPGLLGNDTDSDGNALAAILLTLPIHGTVTLSSNGQFVYVPNTNFSGSDSFIYKANDGLADSSPATARITVTPVNDAPVAVDDAYSTVEDTLLAVAAPGVLANDSDPDGDALSAILVTGPAHGTLTLNPNGRFSYLPNTNFSGADSFTYKANDTALDSAIATVRITVSPVNDAPIAQDDAYSTAEDTALTVGAPGVLGNDSDADGNPLTAVILTQPTHGTVTLSSNGQFVYQPNTNFNGADSFTYKANDGSLDSASATVRITVTPVNDAPIALDDAYSTAEDTLLMIGAPGILGNDSDPDGDVLSVMLAGGPAHGTLTLNSNGGFNYLPNTNFNGADSFTYKANDGSVDSSIATVRITITAVNDVPIAQDDAYTTAEDTTLTVPAPGVLGNDSDADGNPLTAVILTQPAHGTVTLSPNGQFVYIPSTNFSGSDSFTYKANDGSLDSASATVRITVTPVNDAPIALDDAYTTAEDTVLTIGVPGVLGNDSDADGDVLSAILVSGPAHGTLTLNSNGGFNYLPNTNFNGADSFTYRASDGSLDSSVATVRITITAVNDAPIAQDDAYTTAEDTTLTVPAPGVLGNDIDADGNPLTAVILTQPTHGTVTLSSNGQFVYVPSTNFSGSDSFTYKANDGSLDSGSATVRITVTPVNDAPIAVDDAYTTLEDTLLAIAGPGVLANDSDADGDLLRAILLASPAHGTLTLNSNGGFNYLPNTNFSGADSFTYKANDGSLESSIATVRITITAVDDAPIAQDDAYTTAEDTTLTVSAPGVLGNDSDADGNPLTAVILTQPTHGTVTLSSNGQFVYVPSTNFSGSDSFTYKANDGSLDSVAATVRITVTPVNDAPIALDDAYTTAEDTLLTIGAPGILGNDTDPDGDPLRAILLASPAHGTLTLNSNGGFNYLPNTNFNGADSFTYQANDGSLDSSIATVRITITAVNDAPIAQDDAYSTLEDTTLTVGAPGVLGNDSDADGNSLTAVILTQPTHGTVTLSANGQFVYVPSTNFSGSDSFTYKANDGSLDSGSATVRITVTSVNDAPIAVDDNYTTAEDTPLVIVAPGILANDSDADGDALSAILLSGPAHGTLTLNPNGSFNYLPNTNFNGADSFTYKANDGSLDSAVATVRITITSVNDAPVALDDIFAVNEDNILRIMAPGVLSNDSDMENDPLKVALVEGPSHGTLALAEDGSFTYAPAADFNGQDRFSYRASDREANSAIAQVAINVNPVNDPPSFRKGANQLVSENAGRQVVVGWAREISPGPIDEANQKLTFSVQTDQANLFSVQPAISADGTLSYTPALGAYGVATVTVILRDDGGNANGGRDTSDPQTFTITINAPPVVNIASPTNGASFMVSEDITVVADAFDPDGTVTQVEMIQGSNVVRVLTNAPYYIVLTNAAAGVYQFSARATDNLGATGVAAPITITVFDRPPILRLGPIHLNRQTGLFEETVRVINPTRRPYNGIRVLVKDLSSGMQVYNASGQTNGISFVQSAAVIPAGGSVDLTIEYYVKGSQVPSSTLSAELIAPLPPPAPTGSGERITRQLKLPDGTFLIEFNSLSNRIYYVQYSANLVDWKTVVPAINGTGTRLQWVDNGPPKTELLPSLDSHRFYRLILLP